jgi:CheY-like chemotaxis protein/signal transduction histidine kinase
MAASSSITALNEPVFETDLAGHIVFATASLLDLIGLESLKADAFIKDYIAETERTRFTQAFKRVADGKTPSGVVDVHLNSDGDTEYEVMLVPLTGANEKPIGVAGLLRDVSTERELERQANVQGTHLFNLVENVDDACVVESAGGQVEFVNAAFCDLFGILDAPQSLVGIELADVFSQARESAGTEGGPRVPLVEGTLKTEFPLNDGKNVKQRVFPIMEGGKLQGRLYLFKTSARASAPKENAQTTTAAQLTLIERIARELATTVESAGSAIHRAEQLDLPAALLDHFMRVETSARSAFNAIGGLLDFSKFEPSELKSLKLDQAEFCLREALATLMEHVAALAEEKRLQLRLRVEQDVPTYLTGDAPRLMLVLRNLLEALISAIDTSVDAKHELYITVSPEYVSENAIHLNFSVDANSAGKPSKIKPFAPLALMQLAVARQLVRIMEGELENVQRKDALGYSFAAAFPWNETFEPRPRANVVTLTGLPVLIVSNESEQRSELAALMKSWRMMPQEADNATMAMQLLLRLEHEGLPIPLVIVPNNLPVQDGFLLAFRIKHHPRLKSTFVMMLAKGGMPGDAITCRENGISAYLRYPLSANQLNQAIVAVTGISGEESDATHTLITRHSLHESLDGTILVVDSSRDVQLAAAHILKKRGYILTEAESAEQAIAALEQDIFDAVLIDPDMPGFVDVVTDLRSKTQKRPQDLLIIAISGNASEAHRKQCEDLGFNGYVSKPLDKDGLLTFLKAKLPVKQMAAE